MDAGSHYWAAQLTNRIGITEVPRIRIGMEHLCAWVEVMKTL